MSVEIRYRLSVEEPHSHFLNVTIRVRNWSGDVLRLAMPVWTPGSYLVREFSQHVQDMTVEGGATLAQVDKRTWEVRGAKDEVHVAYRVYGHDLSVRTNHVDGSHAFAASAATFFAVEGHEGDPMEVELVPPEGWSVATSLPSAAGEDNLYLANDFDHLVDSPIDMGEHTSISFDALGKKHDFVVWGEGNYDLQAIARDTASIIQASADMFGGSLPYERYLFILHSAVGARGGLEHLDSCVLGWGSLRFQPQEEYEAFLRLVAHEFFHLWNIKRIRPRVLGPFRYGEENYTRMLWFHEGGTVYYEGLIPVRAGVLRTGTWLKDLGNAIQRLESTPGRHHMSVADSSFNAWIKLYRQNEHTGNSTVSYYLKGDLVCMCLDKLIREKSEGKHTLDDVMRHLFEITDPPLPGYEESEFPALVHEVTGVEIGDFMGRYVDGVEPLPLDETLAWYGLKVERRHKGGGGKGGSLGVSTLSRGNNVVVKTVREESAAAQHGIYPGDEIVSIDGYRVKSNTLEKRLKGLSPGERVEVDLFRRERLVRVPVVLGSPPFDETIVKVDGDATTEQKERYESLLGQAWSG